VSMRASGVLSLLTAGLRPVTELAKAIDMEQPAVSYQLRLLRNLGFVNGARSGQSIGYSLYDDHVAQPLDEAVSTGSISHSAWTIAPVPTADFDRPDHQHTGRHFQDWHHLPRTSARARVRLAEPQAGQLRTGWASPSRLPTPCG
jgi:DNA-binding transcriptional ArsR family regulator